MEEKCMTRKRRKDSRERKEAEVIHIFTLFYVHVHLKKTEEERGD